MGLENCTLVLEFNYHRNPKLSLGSVWIFEGDGRAHLESSTPLARLEGWVLVAGPIDFDAAARIHGSLKAFLKKTGVRVIDEAVAD